VIRICANKFYIEDLENPRPKEDHLFQSSLNRAYATVSQWVDDMVTKGDVVPLVDWLSTRCEIENQKGDNRRNVLMYAKRWRNDNIRNIMHAQVKNPPGMPEERKKGLREETKHAGLVLFQKGGQKNAAVEEEATKDDTRPAPTTISPTEVWADYADWSL
jgi:hypothetical protein